MKKFIIPVFCVLFAALSCNKENPAVEEPVDGPKMVTVSCTIADTDPTSKVTLTNDGSKCKTEWEIGDEIFVHGKKVGKSGDDYYSYVATVSSLSADKKTAYFEIPEIKRRHNVAEEATRENYLSDLFAVYPASAVASFSNGTSWYYLSAFKETNHLLLGGYNNLEVNGGNSFTFINLTGAISFKVSGDFDAYVFSGNNGETVGYTNYVIRTDYHKTEGSKCQTIYTGSTAPGPTSGEQTNIAVDSWTGADGTTVNTVYFPNGANFTNGFTIKFYKDGSEVKRVSTKTAKNVAVGKYLDLGNITTHLIDPPATPVNHTDLSDGLDFSTATDLSTANGSSNCYIVTAAGQYKLPLVQGNSATSVGTVTEASILWETYNNNETVTAKSVVAAADYYINGDTKYLVFKTPATLKPGNAVLAVKNALGTILWSWHIWIPETSINTYLYSISSVEMMDRNLGALVVAEASTETAVNVQSYGLLYQWGRKDPFVNIGAPGSTSKATVAGVERTKKGGTMEDVRESIENPTVFGNAGKDIDWLATSDGTLWGDGTTKSQYDPCPPGYRVPNRNKSDGLWSTMTEIEGYSYDKDHNWVKAGTGTNIAVFPLGGIIGYDGDYSSSGVGKRALIWNAHHDGDYLYKAYGQYIYESGDSSVSSKYSQRKAQAGSVRCVRE